MTNETLKAIDQLDDSNRSIAIWSETEEVYQPSDLRIYPADLKALSDEVRKLTSQRDVAVQALGVYADEANWSERGKFCWMAKGEGFTVAQDALAQIHKPQKSDEPERGTEGRDES